MGKYNTWVQCLNCGNEYWADDALYLMKAVYCSECQSTEYIENSPNDTVIQYDYSELNESLMKDGEWN